MKKVTLFALHAFIILWFSHCKKSGSGKPLTAIVTTIAGIGEQGYLDASAAFAKFAMPKDIAVHSDGTIYITDYYNRRIRKLTKEGHVFTLAGTGNFGNTNGSGTMASFKEPSMMATDAQGNIYLLDGSIPQVRKITPDGNVAAFAGIGTYGFADAGTQYAQFNQSWGITVDSKGIVYVADTFNERIRKIENGLVTTVAGTGAAGYMDGNALQAQFSKPRGIAVDKQGNLYVSDEENFRVRKITPAGTVSTYAGNGSQGFADGDRGNGQFYQPGDIVIDKNGNLYVTDVHRIRKVDTNGSISTIAGDEPGFADGEGSQARFQYAVGLGIDAAGNIYVADGQNNRIRKISFK